MHLGRISEQGPAAGLLVELACCLPLVDVAAARIQGHISGLPLQHEQCVGGAGETIGAADHVEGVVSVHFAYMMGDDDRDPALVSNPVQVSECSIVGGVGGRVRLCHRPKLFKRIDHDEGRVLDRIAPFENVGYATSVCSSPLGGKKQVTGPISLWPQLGQSTLQTPL